MPLATNQLMTDIKMLNLDEMLELNTFLVSQIKHERALNAQRMKRQLCIGSRVQFSDGRGNTIEGSISKIMRKFAKVNSNGDTWRVPIGVLSEAVK
jgi:hypothetical protein